ncbi:MAG: hypothetical protein ACJ8D5_05830 [Sphingomicrobium sp.]
MRKIVTLVGAGTIALAPAGGFAAPPTTGSLGPHHATGQQVGDQVPDGLECDEGTPPGNSGVEHGSAPVHGSPFLEESVSGAHYAGEQTQNQKNTASVSQYDIACFGGSPRP